MFISLCNKFKQEQVRKLAATRLSSQKSQGDKMDLLPLPSNMPVQKSEVACAQEMRCASRNELSERS